VIFHAGRPFYPATNINGVGHHSRDRATNIPCVQTARENQESRVTHRGARTGPIARSTRAATELGVVRINEYIALWERCCVLRLEFRIGGERANHAKFLTQFVARFRRCSSMQLNTPNAASFGEFADFCWICIDENTNGADLRR
jgi:hypothetical protein